MRDENDNQEWLDLLKTAKELHRSARPVEPSPAFRQDLRSDLATVLSAPRGAIVVRPRRFGHAPPAEGLRSRCLPAVLLGLAFSGLSLLILTRRR